MTIKQPTPETDSVDRILRIKEVMAITTLGRNTIYRHIDKGTFPKQVYLGEQRVGWRKSDIDAWLSAL